MNERPQSRLRWKVPFSLCMWNPRRWMWWHFLQNKKRPLITRYFYEWSKTQVDDNLFSSLLYSFLFHVSVKYARGYVAREHWKKDILCIFVFLLLPILSYPPTPTFSKQFGPATLSPLLASKHVSCMSFRHTSLDRRREQLADRDMRRERSRGTDRLLRHLLYITAAALVVRLSGSLLTEYHCWLYSQTM